MAGWEFPYPLPEEPLANARLKLVPFSPERHAQPYVDATADSPSFYAHTREGPFATGADFAAAVTTWEVTAGARLFAAFDTTAAGKEGEGEGEVGELAGLVGFCHPFGADRSVEIGPVFVVPRFQRSHVAANMCGLLLQYALDTEARGGLGLARVMWLTSQGNVASVRLAEKLGFRHEGLVLWERRVPKGRANGKIGNGKGLPPGSDLDDIWRDSVVMGLYWDVWAGGERERVQAVMDRAFKKG